MFFPNNINQYTSTRRKGLFVTKDVDQRIIYISDILLVLFPEKSPDIMTILIFIDDVFACEIVLKSSLKKLANKLINKTIFIFCKFVYTKVLAVPE